MKDVTRNAPSRTLGGNRDLVYAVAWQALSVITGVKNEVSRLEKRHIIAGSSRFFDNFSDKEAKSRSAIIASSAVVYLKTPK